MLDRALKQVHMLDQSFNLYFSTPTQFSLNTFMAQGSLIQFSEHKCRDNYTCESPPFFTTSDNAHKPWASLSTSFSLCLMVTVRAILAHTESITPKIRNKTRMSTFTTIIQHCSGGPSYSNQRRKRNKKESRSEKK